MIVHKPFEENFDNKIEIFNEMCILISSYIFNTLLNGAVPVILRTKLGWAFIIVVILNITVNLGISAKQSIVLFYRNIKNKNSLLKAQAINEKKASNRMYLASKCPEKFKGFDYEMKCIEAIKTCRDWNVQVKWLKANKIDYLKFPEEIEAQKLSKEFKLHEQFKKLKIEKTINIVTESLSDPKIE